MLDFLSGYKPSIFLFLISLQRHYRIKNNKLSCVKQYSQKNHYDSVHINISFLVLKLQIKLYGETAQVMLQKSKWDWSYLSDDFLVSSLCLQLSLFERLPSVFVIWRPHNLLGWLRTQQILMAPKPSVRSKCVCPTAFWASPFGQPADIANSTIPFWAHHPPPLLFAISCSSFTE